MLPGVTGGDLKRRITRIMRNETARRSGAQEGALMFVALLMLLAPIAVGVSSAMPRSAGDAAKAVQNDDAGQAPRPGGNIRPPKLKKEVKPQYSERAKQKRSRARF